ADLSGARPGRPGPGHPGGEREMSTVKAGNIIIYGNGAMARVLYSYLRLAADVSGFTVDDACIGKNEATFCDLPLVPFSTIRQECPPDKFRMITAVGFLDM